MFCPETDFCNLLLLCGVVYTAVVTGIAQLLFPHQANGSIIEVDGKKYGSALLGQQYTDDAHLWGKNDESGPFHLSGCKRQDPSTPFLQ